MTIQKHNKPVNEIFGVDNDKNLVKMNLGTQGVYVFQYFSDADVELKLDKNMLSIIIKQSGGVEDEG